MHSAVVHLHGSLVHLLTAAAEAPVSKDPGPIIPELKELYWGGGSFIVFALLMRFVLFPKVKKGMDARYQGIRSAHESADAERSAARAEVAEGVIVREGAVLAMGVFLGASTKIVDRTTGEIFIGEVPEYSVVVPGTLPNDGKVIEDARSYQ